MCRFDATGALITSGDFTNDYRCSTAPDAYAIDIFSVYLCTGTPVAPTLATAADLSVCTAVLASASSQRVTVAAGVNTPLGGTFTRPPVGTYSHAAVLLDNTFRITNATRFDSVMTHAGSSTSGEWCWTTDGTIDPAGSFPEPARCGASEPDAASIGTATEILRAFGSPGTAREFAASGFVANGVLTAYLIESDDTLPPAGANTASRLLAVQAFDTPVRVSDETAFIDLGLRVSQGMSVNSDPGGVNNATDFQTFASGPFNAVIGLR